MLRATCLFLSVFLLAACEGKFEKARRQVEASLPQAENLNIHDMRAYPGDVICGKYDSYGSAWEQAVISIDFIIVRGKLNRATTRMQRDIYCSEQPAQRLLELTGVGPFDAGNTRLARITADLTALTDALERYYADNSRYPTADQGLEALVRPASSGRKPQNFPADGYLQAIPRDPWGRAYIYREAQWAGSKGQYTLTSLGADGAAGGSGENADVGSELLPYLQHVAYTLGQG